MKRRPFVFPFLFPENRTTTHREKSGLGRRYLPEEGSGSGETSKSSEDSGLRGSPGA